MQWENEVIMLEKGNHKQITKIRRKSFWQCRCGALLLAMTVTVVSLSGCGAALPDQRKDSADPAICQPEQAKETVNTRLLKPGMQSKKPDIPYSDQIDTIMQNQGTWCFTMPADAEEEYGLNESNYVYWVSDLNQNGLLEIISSSTSGNGGDCYSEYYELSSDGKSLEKIKTDESEDAPAPDLWSMGEYRQGYYDGKTDTYHYPQFDQGHASAVDVSDAQLDMVLSDGKLTIDTISYVEMGSYGDSDKGDYGSIVKYYAGAKAEKLGEARQPYDEKTNDYIHDTKQESVYVGQLEKLYEQYYAGMQEFTVTLHSFRNIDEENYVKKDQQVEVVSEETLRKRVEESWDRFGIHVPKEKAPANPFFPETAAGDAEVRYLLDLISGGKATMRIQEELRGDDGILYQVSYRDPREISNSEFGISEDGSKDAAEEREYVEEVIGEFYFYLWVTDSQIYYISRFYPDMETDTEEAADVGYDEIEEDEYQKIRLAFQGVMPENALPVCQEEETEDCLKEEEIGDHRWIEKHGEDIRLCRSYTFKGEGYEGINILRLFWKRGEGLIGVDYADHSAGGGGRFFWKEAYLKQEDVGLSLR